jgi:hypothetical protein
MLWLKMLHGQVDHNEPVGQPVCQSAHPNVYAPRRGFGAVRFDTIDNAQQNTIEPPLRQTVKIGFDIEVSSKYTFLIKIRRL